MPTRDYDGWAIEQLRYLPMLEAHLNGMARRGPEADADLGDTPEERLAVLRRMAQNAAEAVRRGLK